MKCTGQGLSSGFSKSNATNLQLQPDKGMALRPSTREPFLTKVTDLIIATDYALFRSAAHSVGKGFVIQKKT